MNWLDKLERKYGHLAINNLIKYIIGFNALVFAFSYIVPSRAFINKLTLRPDLIMKGEIWRLFTYIFIPPNFSPIWIIFALYISYLIGTSLEHAWGSFKLNVYYFLGMLGTTIAAFITGGEGTGAYLNLSLFLAFARIYPNYEFLIFFILPVKVKYLAWLNWFFIGVSVVFSPLAYKVAAIVSVINYFVFFGEDIFHRSNNRRKVHHNRKKFKVIKLEENRPIHKCTVCGITEKDDPYMEFRYCSKCDGHYEYCMDHLKNHEHIKKVES